MTKPSQFFPDQDISKQQFQDWTGAWDAFVQKINPEPQPEFKFKDAFTFDLLHVLQVLAEGASENPAVREAVQVLEDNLTVRWLSVFLALRPRSATAEDLKQVLNAADTAAAKANGIELAEADLENQEDMTMVLAGTNKDGTLMEDVFVDFSNPCPPVCPRKPNGGGH